MSEQTTEDRDIDLWLSAEDAALLRTELRLLVRGAVVGSDRHGRLQSLLNRLWWAREDSAERRNETA